MNLDADDVAAPCRARATAAAWRPGMFALSSSTIFSYEMGCSVVRQFPTTPAEIRRKLGYCLPFSNTSSAYSPALVASLGGFREARSWIDHELWVRAAAEGQLLAGMREIAGVHRIYSTSSFALRHRNELMRTYRLARHLARGAAVLGQRPVLPAVRTPFRLLPHRVRMRLGSPVLLDPLEQLRLEQYILSPNRQVWPLGWSVGSR